MKKNKVNAFLLISTFVNDISSLMLEGDSVGLDHRLDLLIAPLTVQLQITNPQKTLYSVLLVDEVSRQNYPQLKEAGLWDAFFDIKMHHLTQRVIPNELSFSVMTSDFLHDTANLIKQQRAEIAGACTPTIKKTIDIIENSQQHISIDDLVERVGLGESKLSGRFRKEVGVSLKTYLLNNDMALARNFLKYTNLTMAQIADMVGYTDSSYFSRTFKKYVGMVPSEYRAEEFVLRNAYLYPVDTKER